MPELLGDLVFFSFAFDADSRAIVGWQFVSRATTLVLDMQPIRATKIGGELSSGSRLTGCSRRARLIPLVKKRKRPVSSPAASRWTT